MTSSDSNGTKNTKTTTEKITPLNPQPTMTKRQRQFFTDYEKTFCSDIKAMARDHRFADVEAEFAAYGRFLQRHPEAV